MNFLKNLGCAAALSMTFAGAAYANPVLNDWVFNPNGGGFAAGQQINEYLDVNGNAFIQIAPTTGNQFSFTEHAVFNIAQADSNGQLFPINYGGGNITATFNAYGTGTFGGNFAFEGGTITIYQNPINNQYGTATGSALPGSIYGANLGNEIASFNVLAGGGGEVDASGSPINNGQVSVLAQATGMDAGYFFRGNGNDLSMEDIMAFAFTNANTVGEPTSRLVSEVACQYAGFTGAGCNGTAYGNTAGAFFVSNNGQFKLAEVPEPGSLALFGIAMLGAGVISRKRAKQA